MLKLIAAAVLAAATLAVPARAETTVEKLKLRHQTPDLILGLLKKDALPKEVEGILGYPLDNSLFAQGSRSGIEAFRRGVETIDVPITYFSATEAEVTLSVGRLPPQPLLRDLRKLKDAGRVRIENRSLVIHGQPAWVKEALGVVARAVMADAPATAEPTPGGLTLLPRSTGALPGKIEFDVPAGARVFLTGDKTEARLDEGARMIVTDRGTFTLGEEGGFHLQIKNARITLRTRKDGGYHVVIEPLAPAGGR
jgi:hypothetical protein